MPRFCRSEKGRVRERNEDSIARFKLQDVTGIAVADGLGGHPAGDVASEMATETFPLSFQKLYDGKLDEKVLQHCFEDANDAVRRKASENSDYEGMASTLVAAVIQDGSALIGNVGDSQAYLVSSGGIERVTEDQVEKTFSGVGGVRSSTVIAQALGLKENVEPDFYRVDVEDSVLLMCSDGLTDELSDSRIQKIVSSSGQLKAAARNLIEYANERGGNDNISVCLYSQ